MSKIKKIIATAIFFSAWMFFSTGIIITIVNKDVDIKKLECLPSGNQKSMYYWIDDLTISSDLWNTVSVYGWLAALPERSESKEVSVIFKSDGDIYDIKANTFKEDNVLQLMRNNNLNVENEDVRYGISFSPLRFKDGVYQLYLFVRDEGLDGASGIVATNRFIEKNARGVYIYKKISEKIESPDFSLKNKVDGYGWIDEIIHDEEQGYLNVKGWIYADQMDSTFQDVMIGISDDDGVETFYKAYPQSRFDLIGMYGNKMNQNAGFTASIKVDNDNLRRDDIVVYTLNGDAWYSFTASEK